MSCFSREEIMSQKTMNYEETFYGCSITMKQQDIQENWKHTTQWRKIRSFVKNYVKGCGICQQFKIDRNPSHPSYLPIPGAQTTRPFANCSMDFITDLPISEGYDSILVVVDQGLSKGVILCPCTKTITSEDTAQLLLDNLYKRFGLPDKIISDRGPQFAAKAFRELLKLFCLVGRIVCRGCLVEVVL